jgi:SAM-dependent methyltransferase
VKAHEGVVAALVRQVRPPTLLDAPCGTGWLANQIDFDCRVDGVDLYGQAPPKYAGFHAVDLDGGLPAALGRYGAIVCCEGLEHFGNPALFLRSAAAHIEPGGMLIVTTPNVWHPAARLQYLVRGFFPGFPSLVGRIRPGSHMHITPWSFPQLFLYLRLAGFQTIRLHEVDEPKPKHLYEWPLGLPQRAYCSSRARRSSTEEERDYWRQAGSRQSVWGRRLVVSAIRT